MILPTVSGHLEEEDPSPRRLKPVLERRQADSLAIIIVMAPTPFFLGGGEEAGRLVTSRLSSKLYSDHQISVFVTPERNFQIMY